MKPFETSWFPPPVICRCVRTQSKGMLHAHLPKLLIIEHHLGSTLSEVNGEQRKHATCAELGLSWIIGLPSLLLKGHYNTWIGQVCP